MEISRQGFYRHLSHQGQSWKYQGLAGTMWAIHDEDLRNDAYGCVWMHQALLLAQPKWAWIPSDGTVSMEIDKKQFAYD